MPGSPPIQGITLATRVTLARIIAIPVFIVLLIYYLLGLKDGTPNPTLRWWAFGIFLTVAATDALDGYLARARNEVSALGRILDPLADKLLLLSALILLTRPNLPALTPHIPIWFSALVISRDALIIGGYFLVRHVAGNVHVQPRWTGKVATVLQMIAILWVLSQYDERHFPILIGVAGALTALAGLQYLWDGWRQARHSPRAG
ncbi:MAG: CDP-alcohol phosphatidyltransferase family protein [Kiritimatiellae bacterium]|nr:CDP-alcohol phosphatidyltransferase family protein [Kiritimatiellia bacterium]MCO5061713.1 CDP-alcohol phosphatidyltransferase family protein [Kiritimatiellia bacterium]MCO6401028.1 CDP-alcohol phosphatidyltransferase family protein [Verrucomicrobiota bacterium]